jgi:hypothetical protein
MKPVQVLLMRFVSMNKNETRDRKCNMQMDKIITRNDIGVVGIVTAILLVGLVVTVFSLVQTTYVPQWMDEIENDHMDTVFAQFTELKHTLDIQMYEPSSNSIPITTPLTLGSEDIPYFLSQKSSGKLEILENNMLIEIEGDSTESHQIGTIEYTSQNSYFTDQKHIYEAGSVILHQDQGTLLVSKPFLSLTNVDTINISFTVINITSINGKTSAYGSHTCSILTNYSYSQNYTLENITEITISTSYQKPWKEYINSTLNNGGFIASEDYTLSQTSQDIILNLESMPKTVHVLLTIITMNAQIAPGWIT